MYIGKSLKIRLTYDFAEEEAEWQKGNSHKRFSQGDVNSSIVGGLEKTLKSPYALWFLGSFKLPHSHLRLLNTKFILDLWVSNKYRQTKEGKQ